MSTQNNMSIIEANNLSVIFDKGTKAEQKAISDVSFEIREGEFFVFVGQSGSGKSTLLRVLSGLEKGYHGSFKLNLVPGDTTSFVFQQFALLPWLTVEENVSMGLVARHVARDEIAKRVHTELETFGLTHLKKAHPRELSGGQRQRVGIARALVTNPKIIFMDEPFSELDSFTARELRAELLDIWQKRGMTVVMVTHIIEDAVELSDRIGILNSHPGTLEHIVDNPLPRPRSMRSSGAFELEDKLINLIGELRKQRGG